MLILMRHGQTDTNKEGKLTGTTDISLNEEGRREVTQTFLANQNIGLETVVSSPLKRAQETAQPFLNNIEKRMPRMDSVTLDPLLREFDFGCFEGVASWDLLNSSHKDMYEAWMRGECVDHGGENWRDLFVRCQLILDKYAPTHPMQTPILLVTHGYVIRAMACLFMGAQPSLVQSLRIDNAHMMTLDFERGNLRMTGFNIQTIKPRFGR